jgi:hypothetical protein
MNQQEQNLAITHACGWKFLKHREDYSWYHSGSGGYLKEPPDYFNSLDAMHEAEKVLDPMQRERYRTELVYVLAGADIFATATQRAEAFLKTLNLWEDGK